MSDPFDKSRCSFPVPDFASEEEETNWFLSLSTGQRWEILHWMRVWRWGEEAVNAPIDRTCVQVLTLEEFNQLKEKEDAAEEVWREAHGLPPRPWIKRQNSRPAPDTQKST